MDIQTKVENGRIVLVELTTLVADKRILNQLPFKSSLLPEEWETMTVIGWFVGEILNREIYTDVGLFELNGQAYLLRLNGAHWPSYIIERFRKEPQILVR